MRSQDDVRPGINICNYDRLQKLDLSSFGAMAADEASIIKNFTGATTRKMIAGFAATPFKLAATATPAPNDYGAGPTSRIPEHYPSNEMLMRWFISDQTEMGRYRLKHHAVFAFWDWMASWARMAEKPSDMGGDDAGYDSPELKIQRHRAGGFVRALPAPYSALMSFRQQICIG